MSSNKKIYLADDSVFDRQLNKEDLQLAPRPEGKILDAKFEGEVVSFSQDVWRRFRRDKVTVVASIFVVIIIIMAIIGPHMNQFTPLEQNPGFQFLPPRIPALQRFEMFSGHRIMSIQYEHLYRWEDSMVELVDTHYRFIRVGQPYVRMASIRVCAYSVRGAVDINHWFGSDLLGRDLFSRLWQGTRVSLLLGFGVGLMTIIMGVFLGAIQGYYGGKVDMIGQRITEIIHSIPFLPMAVLLIIRFGAGFSTLFFVFFLTGWIGPAQGVRMQFYRFKGREYVLASRTMGASDFRLMFRYILPNAAGTLITSLILAVPGIIFGEAGLSYLGLGIQAPHPSIGMLLADGQNFLLTYPYMIMFPAIVICVLMLAFNLFGNGLRDAFDPSLRR